MSDPSATPPGAPPETSGPAPASAAHGGLMLADLGVGGSADVVGVELEGPIGRRLRDLGFRPGARVTCRRRAPMGDPRVYELAGSQVCLRRTEAAAVRVRALAESASPAATPRE